jgi:hypothetical protein
MEPVFKKEDLQLIKSLVYDAGAEPNYESFKGCLVWPDETPADLTMDGFEKLSSLWVARSLFHQGLTIADHPLDPEYCRNIWDRALLEIPAWPGFRRLTLNDKDKTYYEKRLNEEEQF